MQKKARQEYMIIAGVFFLLCAIYNIFLNLITLMPLLLTGIELTSSYWISFIGSFISIIVIIILGIVVIQNKNNLAFPIIIGIRAFFRLITLIIATILIALKAYGWEKNPYNSIAGVLQIIAYILLIIFSVSRYKKKNLKWVKYAWFIPAVTQVGNLCLSAIQNLSNKYSLALLIITSLGTIAYIIAYFFLGLYYAGNPGVETENLQIEESNCV